MEPAAHSAGRIGHAPRALGEARSLLSLAPRPGAARARLPVTPVCGSLGARLVRLLVPVASQFADAPPATLAFWARVEALPFACIAKDVVRRDPKARLDACAVRLECAPATLADALPACPECRAFVVFGEVPRA